MGKDLTAADGLPKEATEGAPRSAGGEMGDSNMPGKMKGDRMPHEVFHDKMNKALCK